MDEKAYPRDIAALVHYYFELRRKIHVPYPIPALLKLDQLDQFLKETRGGLSRAMALTQKGEIQR